MPRTIAIQLQGDDDYGNEATTYTPGKAGIPEAQVMELQRRWKDFHEPVPEIELGSLVQERPGLGTLRAEFKATTPLILWCLLVDLDPTWKEAILQKFASEGSPPSHRQLPLCLRRRGRRSVHALDTY